MRRFGLALATALLIGPCLISIRGSAGLQAGPTARKSGSAAAQAAPPAAAGRFELTVDSIMRGPSLVGWTPTALRWSADSRHLYFDWRKPADKESSTYVVGRDGGTPRKLTDEEGKRVPPANGRWDKAHRRVLFVDDGDVVMVDGGSGSRRQITRTAGAESNPRWARKDTHVTYVREGNLFIVPVDGSGAALVTQLAEVAPKRAEPRLTDSQKFLRDEEEKLIEFVREQKEQKKKDEEKAKKNKLPAFELQERQTASDLMLSPDDTHLFILVAERPSGAKNAIVPNYVTETGYIEDIPGRSNVGDTQDRRLLAVLNLETGKTAWADASFAAAGCRNPRSRRKTPAGRRSARSAGACRWCPTTACTRSRARARETTRIAGS